MLHGVRKRVGKVFHKDEIPSTFEAMTAALNRTVDALRAGGWIAAESEAKVRLCLEEALVNAIRHGNNLDEARKVTVELAEAGDCCTIKIRDEGVGFCPDEVADPKSEQLGGRGVCLMRHFMDRVFFNRKEHCLELALRRKAS